ncbi:MAG: hypothetical protein DRN42_01035 [Thermoplasmata archaeon]|nr:MAG: hypothetical protein DRN42_01035 [Thermoplasmata archaeon]
MQSFIYHSILSSVMRPEPLLVLLIPLLLPSAGAIYTLSLQSDTLTEVYLGPSDGSNVTFQPNFTVLSTEPEAEREGGLYIFHATGWIRVSAPGKSVAVDAQVVRNSTTVHLTLVSNYLGTIEEAVFLDGDEAFSVGEVSTLAHLEVHLPISSASPPEELVLDKLSEIYGVLLDVLPFSLPSAPSMLFFVSWRVADFTVSAEEGVDGEASLLLLTNITYELKLPRLQLGAATTVGGDVRLYLNNTGEDYLDLTGRTLYVEVRDSKGYPILTEEVNLTDVLSPGDSLRYLLDLDLKPGSYRVYMSVDGESWEGVVKIRGGGEGDHGVLLILAGVILVAVALFIALIAVRIRGRTG